MRTALPIADQGLIAAFNLALQLALIRFATPLDYGLFVVWQSLVMMAVSAMEALVGVPLAVRITYTPNRPRRAALEGHLAAVALFLAVAAGAVAASLVALTAGALFLALSVGAFATAFCLYAATRFLALSRMDFSAALVIDGTYAALSAAGVAAHVAATGGIHLPTLFAILAIAPLAAVVAGFVAMPAPPRPRRRALLRYRPIFRDTRWTLVAAIATEAQNRAYIFILTAIYGAAAMASVFAGIIVLRHIVILTLAWTAFARPYLAKLRDQGAFSAIARFVIVSIGALAGLYVVNLCLVALVWPLVETYVYAGKYEGMLTVVAVWTMISIAQVPMQPLAVALVALGRFRDDSTAVMVGAPLALAAVLALALTAGPLAAICGSLAGLIVTITLMARRLTRELKRRTAP
ncbi:MAG: hypothetical protein AAF318_09120 [Pseudomonadota bacterium]